MNTPQSVFKENTIQFQKNADHYAIVSRRFSIARTIVFISGFAGLIALANFQFYLFALVLFVVFFLLFLILVLKHQAVNEKLTFFRHLVEINTTELKILNSDFSGLDEGKEFQNPMHYYSNDLDIFGKKSLFQLLNRTNTVFGKEKLASWLLNPASQKEILTRQEEMVELSPMLSWRQEFQAKGVEARNQDSGAKTLIEWIATPPLLLPHKHLLIFRFLLPAVTFAIVVLVLTNVLAYPFIFLWLVLKSSLYAKYRLEIGAAKESAAVSATILKSYTKLFETIEKQDFKHSQLIQLKGITQNASVKIKKLTRIVAALNETRNPYYSVIANGLWLSDLNWSIAFERWKVNVQPELEHWFSTLSEFESLASLSAVHFANPTWTFPQISDTIFKMETKEMAHPLINSEKGIKNDLDFSGIGKTIVITGSNMSGKSTFLRTIGVNLVLAQAGCVVCAKEFKLSIMQVFTSMRTQDNLEENISSFYAELKRIRQLLDLLEESGLPVIYFLDEILKGTNSQDRHNGAKGLIMQLGKKNASGFVSTHDLELGELAALHPEKVENYSFNSLIEGDEIIFNYKLQKGICKSFNAAKLMEKMGIGIG